MRTYPASKRLAVPLALLALLAAGPAAGEEVQLPTKLQAALLVKVLSYDRNLPARAGRDVVVGVLVQRGNAASIDAARELMDAIAQLPVPSSSEPRLIGVEVRLGEGELGRALDEQGIEVLYVTPLRAHAIEEVAAVTRARAVRSFTGSPGYVKRGLAVGFGVRNDRPEIVISRSSARAEGAELSAQLLDYARVLP
jgi:hypothetical protein